MLIRCADDDDDDDDAAQITGQYHFYHLTSYGNDHREKSAIIAYECYCHQSTTESEHKQTDSSQTDSQCAIIRSFERVHIISVRVDL